MKIAVVGGGPGGLFAARLLKLARPAWDVDVYERDPATASYGFGVGLGGQVMDGVREADPEVHSQIVAAGMVSDSIQRITTERGTSTWTWGGWNSLSISRYRLREVLSTSAARAGVRVHHETMVGLDDIRDADVVVASDGAKSAIRSELKDMFRPDLRPGRLRTIWLGAAAAPPIDTSMFDIRTDEHGTWALHAYPYGDGMATLVVETDALTLADAGIVCDSPTDGKAAADGRPDPHGYAHLSGLFAEYLAGAELLTSNSRWFRFDMVTNDSWVHGNVALLGDAAHTAHPSIGSGTRMAMEDAVQLTRSLTDHPDDIPRALSEYQLARKPQVEHLQRAALPSQRWWETVDERLDLAPDRLALHYISRTGFYGLNRFTPRAPELVSRAQAEFDNTADSSSSTDTDLLATPLSIGGLELAGRVVRRITAAPGSAQVRELSSPSLILIADQLHAQAPQLESSLCLGVSVTPGVSDARLTELRAAGIHVLEIDVENGVVSGESLEPARDLSARWRSASRPAAQTISLLRCGLRVEDADDALLVEFGETLHRAKSHFDGLSLELHLAGAIAESPGVIFQLADRVRRLSGLPTLLWAPATDIDHIRTGLLTGRIDLIGSSATAPD